jgi:glycerophosphoryl diester phosphodiesterase
MTDTPASDSVALLAHRGYAARYPENTLEAMAAAVDAGALYLEFDIQLSGERVPYLLHDAGFRRTGGVDARIFDLDAAAIAAISVGEIKRFGDEYAGVRAPKLAAMVEQLAGWPDVQAFVEIKAESLGHFGLETVRDAVLPVLAPVLDQCIVISFDADFIRAARVSCGCRIGWAIRDWNEASHELAQQLAPDYLFCNELKIPSGPDALWEGPWTWALYEITDPAAALEWASRGVGMIETMEIAEMHAAIRLADA